MKLTATPKASKRTKNRIAEHSDFVVTTRQRVQCFDGAVGLFATCTCHENPWIGWLPKSELESFS